MKSDLLVEVGQRIRACREALGTSQEDFAREAGVERSFYGKIERGTQNVSLETLARIATALKADFGDLLKGLPIEEPKA
ncbi:helix-turn-helix transcriptional regulator [Sphingomonas naphthae]|uniref:Helix-turn-helix transcriptional regulator n=1 Tax=Sphingomonas naphthae TaxID=1813468 RepID=A0ABY7THA9_9SPHN|nr:helix-turn-helix transcriptional regulator [Sphingomonas naphthae]WCT72617.1 helix-turn-helix transcriptional regulator [Sphingomonas naphthae]